MTQSKFKKLLFCIILVIAGMNIIPLFAGGFIIRKSDNSANVSITELGDLKTDLVVSPGAGTIPETPGYLIIKKVSDNQMAITQDEVLVKNTIQNGNISPSISGDFVIKKADLPGGEAEQAILREGDLILKGESSILPLFSATYYVDEEGVFEQKKGEAQPVFAYADIASLTETEGRTEYKISAPAANYFYIKDHLGSTRMTVDENGDQSENVNYLSYGTEMDLGVSASFTREKYTGKEFDKEGAGDDGTGGIGLYYFGKRYYDAEIGRWISVDPEGQFFDLYAYTGNGYNPISSLDKDGNWLFFESNATKKFKGDYKMAVVHALVNGAAGPLAKLDALKTPIPIIDAHGDVTKESNASAFYSEAGYINNKPVNKIPEIMWNPNAATTFPEGSQSPTVGLLEEAVHALESETNPKAYELGVKDVDSKNVTSEEKRALPIVNNLAARLNEDKAPNYETKEAFFVSDPISVRLTKKKKEGDKESKKEGQNKNGAKNGNSKK